MIGPAMNGKRILLVIGGGIAAYKACELVRLIRKAGGGVTCVLTEGGSHFVTPMTLAALSENQVYTTLWDLKDEAEMGHIQLSREADLIVICPATADLMAKMAAGIADDLAATLLLATDTPVMAVPAMNVRMWEHAATRRNVERLRGDGITVMQPDKGDMACGEYGEGRLPEPDRIFDEIAGCLSVRTKPGRAEKLQGKHIIVTAGPTHEPIDPVRYIANRSSGRQGFAIAQALADLGAKVSLIAGPVALDTPRGVTRIDVETAREMQGAVASALPADAAILVAAVADWRTEASDLKIKKGDGVPPSLELVENPDILAALAQDARRPALLIGFAAETDNVIDHARAKRERKACDWIVANDVSGDVMGGADNTVHLVTDAGIESWEPMSKADVAAKLAQRIADALG